MCNECEDHSESGSGLSRRGFLALSAAAAGALSVAMVSCQDQTETAVQKKAATFPATTSVATLSTAPDSPEPSTEPITAPAPDLGSALFPDSDGRPIAQASDAPCLVIPRTDWTSARPNLAQIRRMDGIQRITVHHTAREITMDAWKRTATELENIRLFHAGQKASDRHWADIAYHFVVDRAGRVWQARPLAYQGAHVKGHNEHNLGIVLLGNFEVQSPAAAQLVSLQTFIGFARRLYQVPLGAVFTHGELGMTSYPGKHLQNYMNRARARWAIMENVSWTQIIRPTTRPATTR